MDKKIHPVQSFTGTIEMPPDKSVSHRSAMFAALADGTSVIDNYSPAADPQTTLKCLRQLGVAIESKGNTITVRGKGRFGLENPEIEVDCGNSGTTMRLLSGIIGGAGVTATLIGDESLSARTMKRILNPLSEMGIKIKAREDAYAPLRISRENDLKPLRYPLPVASAQVKSCVLLAGLFAEEETLVIETIPSRNHTEQMLGLPVSKVGDEWHITSSASIEIKPRNYTIPGDFSSSAFWIVAALIYPNSELLLTNTGINPTRTALLEILKRMGANITLENERIEGAEPVADIRVKSSALKATDVFPDEIPNAIDELPILSVAMSFAEGTSSFREAGDLRHKETDRIMAIAHILEQAGVSFKEFEDGLEIQGNPDFIPSSATYNSFHDHRIAMASAIMSGKSTGTSVVRHAESAAVSYPGFWEDLTKVSA